MYQISHQVATTNAAHYVQHYRDIPRFLGYCRECESFGKVWSCPPFDFDAESLTEGFEQVTLWGTVITFDDETRAACTTDEQRRKITMQALEKAWETLLPFLYEQEAAHPGSRLFTVRCRQCSPVRCSRIDGKACRKPHLMRYSLESVGFDVAATARDLLGIELEWSTDGRLQRHITLVTALFSPTAFEPVLPTIS